MSNDTWGTPRKLAERLIREFGIWLDVCAVEETAVCPYYIAPPEYRENTRDLREINSEPWISGPRKIIWRDALGSSPWSVADSIKRVIGVPVNNRAVWMNPPYSCPEIWCRRAVKEMRENRVTVIGLVRFDPSTQWWVDWVHWVAREVRMLPRLKHMSAPQVANFPQAIVVWDGAIAPGDGTAYRRMMLSDEERGLSGRRRMAAGKVMKEKGAIGNQMAVTVMRWLGERIEDVEKDGRPE